jgi:hypothetical protein
LRSGQNSEPYVPDGEGAQYAQPDEEQHRPPEPDLGADGDEGGNLCGHEHQSTGKEHSWQGIVDHDLSACDRQHEPRPPA